MPRERVKRCSDTSLVYQGEWRMGPLSLGIDAF